MVTIAAGGMNGIGHRDSFLSDNPLQARRCTYDDTTTVLGGVVMGAVNQADGADSFDIAVVPHVWWERLERIRNGIHPKSPTRDQLRRPGASCPVRSTYSV